MKTTVLKELYCRKTDCTLIVDLLVNYLQITVISYNGGT